MRCDASLTQSQPSQQCASRANVNATRAGLGFRSPRSSPLVESTGRVPAGTGSSKIVIRWLFFCGVLVAAECWVGDQRIPTCKFLAGQAARGQSKGLSQGIDSSLQSCDSPLQLTVCPVSAPPVLWPSLFLTTSTLLLTD